MLLERTAPIISGVVMFLGTGFSLYFAAKKKQRQRTQNATDEESGNSDLVPFRLLTVSASTKDYGSLTYWLFVVTAIVHGAFLTATSFFQQRAIDDGTMRILIIIGGTIAGMALILTSLLPAKGVTTCIHVVLGVVYVQVSIAYMIWTIMWSTFLDNNNGNGSTVLFVVRIILAVLACCGMSYTLPQMFRLRRLSSRGKESDAESEWYDSLHQAALGQVSFGSFFAVFLCTIAIDL